jgi:DNA-binding NtrC family response regulator
MSPGNVLSADFLPEEIVTPTTKSIGRDGDFSGHEAEILDTVQGFCEQIGDPGRAREAIHRIVDESIIRKTLAQTKSERKTAEMLKISRMTLRKKISEYGINE